MESIVLTSSYLNKVKLATTEYGVNEDKLHSSFLYLKNKDLRS